MKKIKLLPSIIMLALCLAVLGIGVYSATTGSNTISGTLTVNSAGHEVEITVYKDSVAVGNIIGATTTSRAGVDIELSDLEFNSDEANSLYDVDMIDVIIAVTNKSAEDVGVYFWNGTTIASDEAAVSNILYGHHFVEDTVGDNDELVDAEYSFYNHIPAKVGNTTTTVYMHVYLRLEALTSEDVDLDLDIALNVEKYVSTATNVAFVKMGTTSVPDYSGNSTLTHMVVKHGTTSIYSEGFYSCANLRAVTIPSTITWLSYSTFDGCSNLQSIILPNSLVAMNSMVFARTGLKTIVFPSTMTFDESSSDAFTGCSSLKSVLFKSSGVLRTGAFNNCTALVNVKLGAVTVMEDTIFSGCTSLRTLTIPTSMTTMGLNIVSGCTNLSSVIFENTTWYVVDTDYYEHTLVSQNLSDPAVACTCLKTTYADNYTWSTSAS